MVKRKKTMKKVNRYICIHGHFYQPPRENAWLEAVEQQDSAAPFHDWNERINFECYAPNAAARILNPQGHISKITNNYAQISFNMGPTLLSWLELADPATYAAMLAGDRASREMFRGHGAALAQVYNHIIMPLANERDKRTQIRWGIEDFVHRFGRQPEGMWLAETAVDTPTLSLLAEAGILFTILAPRQAKAVRPLGSDRWQPLEHGVDTRRPYRCLLPGGKHIDLFFYDGNISQAVAFEGLLNDGKYFARRLREAFDGRGESQLVHIATDGESYGHHHRKGEMALADCLDYLRQQEDVALTIYGEYLELHPPEWEVQIHENSSWSCVHGVERWRSDCGCNSGGKPGWRQHWRAPLRAVLDWLRDQLIPLYEQEAAAFTQDPWALRDAYIAVILDRSPDSIDRFFDRYAPAAARDEESRTRLLRLLEMQRHCMLMYTSCGWFFDEISGIETMQILQYANRAMYYAQQVRGVSLHESFLEKLRACPSNVYANGAEPYLQTIIPARIDLERVAMHYAVASLFEPATEQLDIFNYQLLCDAFDKWEAGGFQLVAGRVSTRSKLTLSRRGFTFAALHLGQQNVIGKISNDFTPGQYQSFAAELSEAFQASDLGLVFGIMQQYLGDRQYSLSHLFHDEQRKVLQQLTDASLQQVEVVFRHIFNDNYQLMTSMQKAAIPLPQPYLSAISFVLNRDLHVFIKDPALPRREARRLATEFGKWRIPLTDTEALQLAAGERLYQEMRSLQESPDPIEDSKLRRINRLLDLLEELGLQVERWQSQNVYCSLLGKWTTEGDKPPVFASPAAAEAFIALGKKLAIETPNLVEQAVN